MATTPPRMKVSRRLRVPIIAMRRLRPGICCTTPPIRLSIDPSRLRCCAKSSRVAYAWLGVSKRKAGEDGIVRDEVNVATVD